MRRGALAAILGTLVVAGCDLSSALRPTPRRAVVHAVLDAGSLEQFVFLEWAHTGSQVVGTGSFGATDPIAGAQVTITAPDSTVMTAEPEIDQSSRLLVPGFYRLSLVKYVTLLTPGGRYALKVILPSGEEITGTTTIPAVAIPTATSLETLRFCDTLRLRWARVPNAAAYEVRIQVRGSLPISGEGDEIGTHVFFADSLATIPGSITDVRGNGVFFPGFSYDIVVSAVDANYYDFYRTLPDPFTPALPTKLRGALGVFGSIAPLLIHPVQAANCATGRP
jgi:hypothetical protein